MLSLFDNKYYKSIGKPQKLVVFIHGYNGSPEAIDYAVEYGMICCVGSIFMFVESIFTKIHQAHGNMLIPMIAQVSGAITNIIFDPLLIFGVGFFPELGIKGAAIATVLGQLVAAIIVGIKGFRKSLSGFE